MSRLERVHAPVAGPPAGRRSVPGAPNGLVVEGPSTGAVHAGAATTGDEQMSQDDGHDREAHRRQAEVPHGQQPHGQVTRPYGPQPYGPPPYGYGYPPLQRTNGLAIASMVLGIVWIYWIGSILALVFGYVAKKQIRERGEGGGGMATAGIVLGWVGVGVLCIPLVFAIAARVG